MPQEYIDFRLMKFYKCTPEELDRMDDSVVEMHINFMRIDVDNDELNQKRAAQREKLKE